jgi:hypothetical protein
MFIAYPSVSASPCISRNQNQSLHDQDMHTSVQKSNGGVTRRNMKNVLSHMFSPLLSLHPYSFSHSILSLFSHCLITFIFPLPFSTLNHFPLFLSTFTFISLFLYFPISFYFPFHISLSHFSISFLFPFSFPKFHVIPLFPIYFIFHFSYFFHISRDPLYTFQT